MKGYFVAATVRKSYFYGFVETCWNYTILALLLVVLVMSVGGAPHKRAGAVSSGLIGFMFLGTIAFWSLSFEKYLKQISDDTLKELNEP